MPQFVLTRFLTLFAGFIVVMDSASGVLAEDAKPDFRAGTAASNITPPLGEQTRRPGGPRCETNGWGER